MARIRTVKPEFWSSPNMAGANPWGRLLFIAMWNWADDTGRGTANIKELAAFAFPHDDDPEAPTAAELPSLLAEIRGRFGVVFYEVDGRRFYAIPSWDKHQRNERRAKSRFPAPEEGVEYHPCPSDQRFPDRERKVTEVPPQDHGSSDGPHGSSGPGTGEQGNRGTGEKDMSATAPPPAPAETREDVEQVCERLRAAIVSNGSKDPGISSKWRTEARLLLDRDGRDLEETLFLVDWCQHNDFWRSNILSMPKFRQKYDTLRMQSQRGPQLRAVSGGYQPYQSPVDQSAYDEDLR